MKYNVVSSGYKTADAVISGTGALLHGVILLTDASNAANVIIYDNATTSSGDKVAILKIPASTTAPQSIIFNSPIECNKGIYADVTGTNATYIVLYSSGN